METLFIVFAIICIISAIVMVIMTLERDRNMVYTKVSNTGFDEHGSQTLGMYNLPETTLEIEVRVKIMIESDVSGHVLRAEIIQRDFMATTGVQVDNSVTYSLLYKENSFANEEIAIAITEEGLLESLDAVSDNQTAKIVASLVKAPEVMIPDFTITPQAEGEQQITFFEFKEYNKTFKLNAWETVENKYKVEWIILVYSEARPENEFQGINAGFTVKSKLGPNQTPAIGSVNQDESIAGILFRPKTRVSVLIESLDEQSKVQIDNLSYIHKGFIYPVPIRTTPFAKRKQKLVIEKGQLISHTVENPSSINGFISIPIDIGKALISIPAQIISIRINTITRRKELETAEGNLFGEILKNQEKQQKLKEFELNKRKEELNYEQKILQLKSTVAQTKIDGALEIQRLEKVISELKSKKINP